MFTMALFSMTWPTDELSVESSGAVASTAMVSDVVPTYSTTSTLASWLTCSTSPLTVAVLNPVASAVRLYSPMGSSGIEYSPV